MHRVPEVPPPPPDVDALLLQLTLEEKAALTSGDGYWSTKAVERLGIAKVTLNDGPHGLRKPRNPDHIGLGDNVEATCFPTASALAATWDPELVFEVGAAIADEARSQKVSVVLGPGANIKRTPLCGRNFEYFSEDPLVSSTMAAAWVRGCQSRGVGASLKHFAANNQEHRRLTIDALVDERALREIYLAAFERAVVEARPWTVMAAYNRLNGPHCTEHRELLTTVLREEWHFDGLVVSDWGAVLDRATAIGAGLDLEMPGISADADRDVLRAVSTGTVSIEALDRAARSVLVLAARAASSGYGPDPSSRPRSSEVAWDAHHRLARRAAAGGVVLLQNRDGLLPISPDAKVAVVGSFAAVPRYQGAGSSNVNPHRVEDALGALRVLIGEGGSVEYAPGYHRDQEEIDEQLLDQAREVARNKDVVLVFVGLPERYEAEGIDRDHMHLPPAHDALVDAVAEVNSNVAVVLANGAPVQMPWSQRVRAIVEAYLGGQAAGSAVAEVLMGLIEPSGRLAETFPHRWEDNPVYALEKGPRHVEYRESIFVGYRYYDTAGVDVLFPFGHGLSYTKFEYCDLDIGLPELIDRDGLTTTVSVTVSNTGDRPGAEVVQMYLRSLDSAVFRPAQELVGFKKVWLDPQESQVVKMEIDRRSFCYWSVAEHSWVLEPGLYEIRVGSSSRDIRLSKTLKVSSANPLANLGRSEVDCPPGTEAYRQLAPGQLWSAAAFGALYGSVIEPNQVDVRGSYTLDTPISDIRESLLARLLLAEIRRQSGKVIEEASGTAQELLVTSFIDSMPLRGLVMASEGKVSRQLVELLLLGVNGHHMRAMRSLIDLVVHRLAGMWQKSR